VRPSYRRSTALLGSRRGQAPYVLIGILAALLAAVPAAGAPGPSLSTKQAEARQVLAQVDALSVSLDIANERLNFANVKLAHVQSDMLVNRREIKVARHNLVQSRATIAKRLVTLYLNGESSTLEIILGAKNIDQVLSELDVENRVSALDAEVIDQVQRFGTVVKRRAVVLAEQKQQVALLVADRRRQQHVIEVRIGERRRLLSSLNGEIQRLIAAQQARELAAARAARARVIAQQSRQAATYSAGVVGASAFTPEGAAVIAPSPYQGVVGYALSEIGTPYVWAGSAPGGFDCSGLVMWAYAQIGVSLPHSSYALMGDGISVPRDQLQPGDLVFFEGGGHVGMYIGGGEFVHAPHTGDVVKVSSLDSGSYFYGFIGARRIL